MNVIRTSSNDWIKQLAEAYKDRREVTFIDDAGTGIDPREQTLLQMGRKSDLSVREWAGVVAALGVAGVGMGLVVAAILSPEPTSTLTALVAGGLCFIGSGGMSAVSILRGSRPPTVVLDSSGFKLTWEKSHD